ncbi:MAG: cob(I)yrinic acid a,c-diamide adenosyltransferase [Casimicrobiaceae bacterium]
MGHRLSKIVTKTGDQGTTGLADGSRLSKDSARIDALGAIDELNSAIGVLLAEGVPADVANELIDIQHDLFDCGGEMAIPGFVAVTAQQVERLENGVDRHNGGLAPLKEFILPGGTKAAAVAHLARTIARRAERSIVHLAQGVRDSRGAAESPVGSSGAAQSTAGSGGGAQSPTSSAINPVTLQYLNRLSDYLFVIARVCNQRAGRGDVLWQKGKNR